MSNNLNDKHSSPGIYTQITDLQYAANTLGITTLGVVGETKKGPAFEPVYIEGWDQFTDYFGDTSTDKFKDSQYPKYELPYIAKSYLTASNQLYVCRVLGLSGYNAGPAWLITAGSSNGTVKYVVAILRSRGHYNKYGVSGDICNGGTITYDTMDFDCDSISLEPYTNVYITTQCDEIDVTDQTDSKIALDVDNLGQFTIVAKKNNVVVGRYPVSLNAGTKEYVYNVLGSDPTEGSAAVFVEELYDLRLQELINDGKVDYIIETPTKMNEVKMQTVAEPCKDFVTIPYGNLTRKQLGQTFLCNVAGTIESGSTESVTTGYKYYDLSDTAMTLSCMTVGEVYQVKQLTVSGKKTYAYVNMETETSGGVKTYGVKVSKVTKSADGKYDEVKVIKVLSYDRYFHLDSDGEIVAATNMSDYREQFRCASTPWIVSELKGDGKDLQVKKLFRFHTITDGNAANTQVKISICNVSPDEGTFDVQIRDYTDSDGNVSILESYKGLTMVPGSSTYIGLKIGTLDGEYEQQSKYVMVEVIENEMTETCVPCGYLGYPVRSYDSVGCIAPTFTYNTIYDEEIKDKKQYFGLSSLKGVDVDMLYYKGKNAYTEDYTIGYTNPFHLDSTLNPEVLNELQGVTVTIDGDETTKGITWDAVSPNQSTGNAPIIATEELMEGTIYEKKALRKFTVYPYGGFDGWDIYRNSRTNTDEYKATKYKGQIAQVGTVGNFTKITDGDYLALPSEAITTDYYAYLAGYNQFEIPERNKINLFATPGIDYVNNTQLVNEVIDMIENKRADSLYIVTTPDKPWGASDARDEMYTSSEAAENLDDTNIDTYYAATLYPWIKFYDSANYKYINLPATKDIVRNLANVDNKKYPWYAPAGMERGEVDCTKMHFFAKLEDEDNVYDGRINPLKTFSEDGVKIWGNKTMYSNDTPMNRINVIRLVLYMRQLIMKSCMKLIFDPNDTTLVDDFKGILNPILEQIKTDRGITDFRLDVSQTAEQMDAHEMSAKLWIKPTPTLEKIDINFVVTPQGVEFEDA